MNCINHEHAPAVAVCSRCGQPLCEDCAIHWQDAVTCKRCLEKAEGQGQRTSATSTAATPVMRKSPVLAGLLSLLPGMGQVYVGYYVTGFIYLLITALTISFLGNTMSHSLEPLLGLFLTFFWIFNIIDAVRRAQDYNRLALGEQLDRRPTDSPLIGGIILLVLGLILTLEITFGIRLEFLELIWPLGVLAGGVYLIIRYFRTREALREERMQQALSSNSTAEPQATASTPGDAEGRSIHDQG